MELGIVTGGAGQEGLPLLIVEAMVPLTIGVKDIAFEVVVELDPQAIKLDMLEKVIHNGFGVVQRTLRSSSDNIVTSGYRDQFPKCLYHPLVA